MLLLILTHNQLPTQPIPGNRNNFTFDELMQRLPPPVHFEPKIHQSQIFQNLPEKYIKDPIKYYKELNQIRIDNEQIATVFTSNQTSTDPMLRLNPLMRSKCLFNEITDICKIISVLENDIHPSLKNVKFSFQGEIFDIIHRYRDPYAEFVKEKQITVGNEYKCVKMSKISGEICNEIEFDFVDLDWS